MARNMARNMVQYLQFRNLFLFPLTLQICYASKIVTKNQGGYDGLWEMNNSSQLICCGSLVFHDQAVGCLWCILQCVEWHRKNSPPRNLQKQIADDMTRCGHLVDLMSKEETKNSGLPLRTKNGLCLSSAQIVTCRAVRRNMHCAWVPHQKFPCFLL